MSERMVFFKLVTSGPDPRVHRVLEFAGLAYDVGLDNVCEEIVIQVKANDHDLSRAQIGIDTLAGYKQDVTMSDAKAVGQVSAFLSRHATIEKVGRQSQQKFRVTRLAGHGVAKFDFPMLRRWFDEKNEFLPAELFVADTVQFFGWTEPHLLAVVTYDSLLAECPAYSSALEAARASLQLAKSLWTGERQRRVM